MNWTDKIARAFGRKAISQNQVRHPGYRLHWFDMVPAPDLAEMEDEIGDGTTSDVLMTPLNWIQDAFLEAPLIEVDKKDNPNPGKLQKLLDQPNPFYAWEHLSAGTIYSLALDGNAYWIKAADGNGELAELWYVPHTLIEPKWEQESGEFITHYEYNTGGVTQLLEVDDVVHFRRGMDPENPRKGISRLKGLLRTVWTDKEISIYSAAILKNGGVGGVVLAPMSAEHTIEPEEADATEQRINARITRTNRGKTLVFRTPVKVEKIGFSPAELDLSPLGNRAEERVCAALGVQAAVVGFGSGMAQTKVGATATELRQWSWMGGILPIQRVIEGEIDRSLAPDLDSAGVMFDNEQVTALREDQDSRSRRITEQFRAGLITRGVAKGELGHDVDETADDVYLLPFSTQIVPASQARGTQRQPLAEVVPIAQQRGAAAGEQKQGDHSLLEQTVAARESRTPPRRLQELANRLARIRAEAEPGFMAELEAFFASLGRSAGAAARDALTEFVASPDEAETKVNEEFDARIAQTIIDEMNLTLSAEQLAAIYGSAYVGMSREVAEAISAILQVVVEITDPVQLDILRAGGTRAGLVDLERQTREAIFEALVEGRERGLAGDNLARLIRDKVEAGPWSSPEVRARVIARTEGAFAANTSVLQGARAIEGVELMMVHDNMTGHNDEVCSAMDGSVVTMAEAAQLIADEHPNGTRSLTPIPPLLAEEMGL